jgi:hypothetical protein
MVTVPYLQSHVVKQPPGYIYYARVASEHSCQCFQAQLTAGSHRRTSFTFLHFNCRHAAQLNFTVRERI